MSSGFRRLVGSYRFRRAAQLAHPMSVEKLLTDLECLLPVADDLGNVARCVAMGSVRGGSARFAEERKPVLTRETYLGGFSGRNADDWASRGREFKYRQPDKSIAWWEPTSDFLGYDISLLD
jgi:hypothetical protein